MSFLKLIITNPFRRKTSAILAIVGICIGITTIVALGGITEGLIDGFEETIHAGGADFTVTGKDSGTSAYGTNTISSNWTDKIANIEGVDEVFPIFVILTTVGGNPYFTLIGINPEGSQTADLSIIDGRMYVDNASEIIIGKLYAEDEDLTVGDHLQINGEDFNIVGIYETGDESNDGSAYTSINKIGDLMGDDNHISNIYVKVDKGVDVEEVADEIEDKYGDNLTTVTSVMEMNQMADMLNMLKAASAGISLLAIIIGGLGVINTMLMSIFERTREIGVLKAVGWSNRRILIMIIGEALVITIISAILGSILGYVLISVVAPVFGFTPYWPISIFVQAFIVAIVVGIIGGIFPALKAMKLPPTESLRYE